MVSDALKSGSPALKTEVWAWLAEKLPKSKLTFNNSTNENSYSRIISSSKANLERGTISLCVTFVRKLGRQECGSAQERTGSRIRHYDPFELRKYAQTNRET